MDGLMAANKDEKTEPATPRRLREARTKGQVARSQDLVAAVLLVMAFLGMRFLGPRIWRNLSETLTTALSSDSPMNLEENLHFASVAAVEAMKSVAPFLILLFLAIVVTLYAQVGLLFTLHPLIPSLSKINPLNGIKRLFSIRALMTALTNIGKLLVVGTVAYMTLRAGAAAIVYAFTFSVYDVVPLVSMLMFDLGIKMAVALLILALLDFAWQRYRHERDLRMTKEEVKDEMRSMEGDPQIKRHRRQVQLQLAMQRLGKDVPTADVVVTNPTHVALAIQYDADTMSAPKVVAKGADYVALRIRQIASEFGIPIVERRTLARALYDSVEVGQYIPERFYQAIAEILAYIYELTGRPDPVKRELAGV